MKSTSKVKEIYLPIKGFEGLYEIGNLGNVKSLSNNLNRKERILKSVVNSHGYYVVNLSKKGKTKIHKIHQLLAVAFLGHTTNGFVLVVNHINFNRADNRLENLEIITHRKNTNRKHIKSSSKYTGVHLQNASKKWIAAIAIKGKNKYLGIFESEIDASNAYQKELSKL